MRIRLLLMAIALMVAVQLMAQVGINTDNSAPDPSAILDAKSTDKGFLPPRMTQAQRDAIVSPAEGLIVICTNCGVVNPAALSIYINGAWRMLTGYCTTPLVPVAGTHTATLTGITWNWNTVANATGYKWGTTNNSTNATDMGTATSKAETGLTCNTTYTRYIWAYNDCGLSPVLATQRNTSSSSPTNPIAGTHVPGTTQIVWNWNAVSGALGYKWNTSNNFGTATDMGTNLTKTETGLSCNFAYTRYIWAYGACGNSNAVAITATTLTNPPALPIAGAHVPSLTQVIWKWNAVAGATGYKWNITNNYATATDMGTVTTKTETGLVCDSTYTRYVWAYGACGSSVVTVMVDSTLVCWLCGQAITDGRDAQVYNTVLIGTQCWFAQNLNIGAMISNATSQTNNGNIEKYCYGDNLLNCATYGGLYQWDEFMNYTASSNANPSGRQGICPAGWHIPSDVEWCQLETYLDASVICTDVGWRGTDAGGRMKETGNSHWTSPNTGATNASGLTILPGGYRDVGGGFGSLSNYANLWSSAEHSSTQSWLRYLGYNLAQVNRNFDNKTYSFSGRCCKD